MAFHRFGLSTGFLFLSGGTNGATLDADGMGNGRRYPSCRNHVAVVDRGVLFCISSIRMGHLELTWTISYAKATVIFRNRHRSRNCPSSWSLFVDRDRHRASQIEGPTSLRLPDGRMRMGTVAVSPSPDLKRFVSNANEDVARLRLRPSGQNPSRYCAEANSIVVTLAPAGDGEGIPLFEPFASFAIGQL
jgi:hypothetical protein